MSKIFRGCSHRLLCQARSHLRDCLQFDLRRRQSLLHCQTFGFHMHAGVFYWRYCCRCCTKKYKSPIYLIPPTLWIIIWINTKIQFTEIQKFTKHMNAMFYVKVKFSHSFHFETNKSKSIEEISTGIVTEIRSRTEKFLTVFDWMSFATSFFVLFMLLRWAIRFQQLRLQLLWRFERLKGSTHFRR